jgi:hypothetical protein
MMLSQIAIEWNARLSMIQESYRFMKSSLRCDQRGIRIDIGIRRKENTQQLPAHTYTSTTLDLI